MCVLSENVRHSAAFHKLLVVCTFAGDGSKIKCLVSVGYNS